jgi:hypothetical protein
MAQEQGLYTGPSEDDFKSDKQIKYENLTSPTLIREKVRGRKPSFYEWIDEFARRRDLKDDVEGIQEVVDVKIETNEPIIIGLLGDIHTGGHEVDYELLAHDVAFIAKHPQAYVVGGGDLLDGFFFNPAQDEQIGSYNQQRMFVRSMVEELGYEKFLLLECGDHDMWASKMGATIYDEFRDETGIPVVRGSTKTNIHLPEVTYKMVSAHQLPGHSMYNDTHPENRESKFGTQGADIYVGWHTHQKAIAEQVADLFEEEVRQLFISGGPYKYSDAYAKKKGWSKQRALKRGALWLVLTPFNKNAKAFYTAEEAERYL